MDNLQGRVTVNRKKGTNITAEEVKGQVNQAPVRLSGKILGVGTPNLVVDVKANAKQLELAHLRELFPALKKLSLAGTVDMDLDVYIPYATAMKSRLNGMLATRNLSFQLGHMTVEKGDAELNLTGNTAFIKRAQAQVNGTLLAVTGQIANPVEPNIKLLVTSPDLNLDRLLPPARRGRIRREAIAGERRPCCGENHESATASGGTQNDSASSGCGGCRPVQGDQNSRTSNWMRPMIGE